MKPHYKKYLYRTRRLLANVLVCCLLLSGGIFIVQAEDVPHFEASDCWFQIPAGVEVTCGYVIVPEDRAQPMTSENTIQLAVATLHMPGANSTIAPIFFLEGGPGASGIRSLYDDEAVWEALLPLAEARDLVAIDQRGTGYSIPALVCPPGEDLRDCREHLVTAGIHLTAYNSANNAADINDIRLALGYAEVNLYGGSYGTRLALTLMRDHPQGLRSIVLDSVVPLQVHIDTSFNESFIPALDQLFRDCEADPSCNAAYPDLESTFYSLMDALNAQPVTIAIGTASVPISDVEFGSILFQALYYIEAIPYLPLLIHQTAQGEVDVLTSLIMKLPPGELSEGMFLSVYCAEETLFLTEQEVEEEITTLPPSLHNYALASVSGIVELCQLWDVPRASSFEEEPVTSDVPTLLLAGQYDPVTRLPWAELAAETLSHSYVFEIPGQGHGAIRSDCAQTLVNQFLDEPTSEPDATCISQITNPVWVTEEAMP